MPQQRALLLVIMPAISQQSRNSKDRSRTGIPRALDALSSNVLMATMTAGGTMNRASISTRMGRSWTRTATTLTYMAMMSLAGITMMLMSITHLLKKYKNKGEETVQLTNDEITMRKTMTSIITTLTMRRKEERLPVVGEATVAITMSKSTGICQAGVYLNTKAPVDTIIVPEETAEAETI